jgi:Protein of unknown function (DUF1203)
MTSADSNALSDDRQHDQGMIESIASMTTFRVHALPAELLDRVRTSGVDDLGGAVEQLTAEGGEPVRCCLSDATEGEGLLLFGYQPPLPASPYRETGAVLVHAEPCAGPTTDGYPPDWFGRPQVLRAYDERDWIHHPPPRSLKVLVALGGRARLGHVLVAGRRSVPLGCG